MSTRLLKVLDVRSAALLGEEADGEDVDAAAAAAFLNDTSTPIVAVGVPTEWDLIGAVVPIGMEAETMVSADFTIISGEIPPHHEELILINGPGGVVCRRRRIA